MQDFKSFKSTPFDEVKCVWMSYGFVDYKLCENNYDCDGCKFYDEVRKREPELDTADPDLNNSVTISNEEYLKRLFSFLHGYQIRNDLYYNDQHAWVKYYDWGKLCVGLDDFLISLLPKNISITFLNAGSYVKQGQPVCWITTTGFTFTLNSPVSGYIERINQSLLGSPAGLFNSPYDDGWLFFIKPDNFRIEKKRLKNSGQMEKFCSNNIDKIENKFLDVIEFNTTEIGMTMMDGGALITNLIDLLGHEKYNQIIISILSKPSSSK